MRVARLDDRLAQVDAPAAELCAAPSFGKDDTLVVCAGFEDRATELLRRAVAGGSRDFRVVCIDYLPPNLENRKAEVRQLCSEGNANLQFYVYDRESPSGAAAAVLERAKDGALNIDISGMSRLLIVQLLSESIRTGEASRATVWYTEAEQYPPSEEEVAERSADVADAIGTAMFLSSGVFGLSVVPELSSVAMQGQPMVLVAFPSWNTMQLAALRAELQASSFVAVHGIPPGAENSWRPDAIARLNNLDALGPRKDVNVSTLDYREMVRALVAVYREHGQREKIVIAPTGSKMQSVGVGIACGWLQDIQVVYPTPREFCSPKEYTHGARAVYRTSLQAFDPSPET